MSLCRFKDKQMSKKSTKKQFYEVQATVSFDVSLSVEAENEDDAHDQAQTKLEVLQFLLTTKTFQIASDQPSISLDIEKV